MTPQVGTLRSLAILGGYRARLWEGILQDIRQRYAGSVFGVAWAVLFPLLQLALYTVIYVAVFKIRPSGLTEYQYVVLVFSGLVPLFAFSEALQAGTGSLSANRALLMNTVFPAELIPVRAALAFHAPTLVALAATLCAGAMLGQTNWVALPMVPLLWCLLLMFALGLAWVLALFTLVARDIQHVLGLVLLALFILSPFAYTPDMVPAGLRGLLYLNPLSYYVLCFQQVICFGRLPAPELLAGAAGLSAVTFFGGFWLFRRLKYAFFDYA